GTLMSHPGPHVGERDRTEGLAADRPFEMGSEEGKIAAHVAAIGDDRAGTRAAYRRKLPQPVVDEGGRLTRAGRQRAHARKRRSARSTTPPKKVRRSMPCSGSKRSS